MYKNSLACHAPAGPGVRRLPVLYIGDCRFAALSSGGGGRHIAAMPTRFGRARSTGRGAKGCGRNATKRRSVVSAAPLRSAPGRLRRGLVLAVCVCLAATGCKGAGDFLRELLRERPPAALDSIPLASDARIDSAGYLAGSFVGEGTSRAIHLLSSDSVFIGELMR